MRLLLGRSSMDMPQPDLNDRFHGCLLGCAVGDALGAPFEGYWDHQLPSRAALLREFYEVEGYPRGQYTDDTQLTVATIESIVRRGDLEPADVARSIASLWKHDSVVGPGGACTRAATTLIPAHLASGVLGSERIKLLASQYHAVVTARGATPDSMPE